MDCSTAYEGVKRKRSSKTANALLSAPSFIVRRASFSISLVNGSSTTAASTLNAVWTIAMVTALVLLERNVISMSALSVNSSAKNSIALMTL